MEEQSPAERTSEELVKAAKTTENKAPEKQGVLPVQASAWCLPDGRALAEFALASGFLAPQLMGTQAERRGPEVDEAGLPPAPLRTRPK
jgi:hypothetical protein